MTTKNKKVSARGVAVAAGAAAAVALAGRKRITRGDLLRAALAAAFGALAFAADPSGRAETRIAPPQIAREPG